jgi:hypothetical protein
LVYLYEVSRTLVAHLINEMGYSLQGNRRTPRRATASDRDAQFGYINTQVTMALADQQPVISVDTKKKELVGDFRNHGREYCPQGNPEEGKRSARSACPVAGRTADPCVPHCLPRQSVMRTKSFSIIAVCACMILSPVGW